MDYKTILEILRFVNKSDLTDLELEDKDIKLVVRRRADPVVHPAPPDVSYLAPQPYVGPVVPTNVPLPYPQVAPVAASATPDVPVPPTTSGKQKTITSPMIGTFYRAPGPDKEPFVKVGDRVSKGQTLCIIEAMKLFNEIESEVEGTIVKILVENATPVEYEQPLFIIE